MWYLQSGIEVIECCFKIIERAKKKAPPKKESR
jgi:hypothetical protein